MGKKAGIINGLSHTLEEAQARLTTALKTFYKEIKPDAPNLREEFLDGLAAARAEAKGTSFEAERKTLRYEEATKKIFRQIKASKSGHRPSCISQVYHRLSTEEGRQNREITTDKEQI